MSVKVRCFASLREELGFGDKSVEYQLPLTIGEIWMEISGRPAPENLLCALNHEYSKFSQTVQDGDEVAFFPPVNGG
ncbi:MAG: MoaD/ThiS family protein [Gammaproteobacteria bacterium]|nr:MoaD/ThiS family protein [Gammaproteobacteria bacterium]